MAAANAISVRWASRMAAMSEIVRVEPWELCPLGLRRDVPNLIKRHRLVLPPRANNSEAEVPLRRLQRSRLAHSQLPWRAYRTSSSSIATTRQFSR